MEIIQLNRSVFPSLGLLALYSNLLFLSNINSFMQLIRGIGQLSFDHKPSVVSIGNYDGVHKGHQHVINTLLEKSDELSAPSTVITFEPLAKEFFSPGSVMRLTSLEERAELLFALGVERVLCINFTQEFAAYSPMKFVVPLCWR